MAELFEQLDQLFEQSQYEEVLQFIEINYPKSEEVQILQIKIYALCSLEKYSECIAVAEMNEPILEEDRKSSFFNRFNHVSIYDNVEIASRELELWEKSIIAGKKCIEIDTNLDLVDENNYHWIGFILHVHLNKKSEAESYLLKALALFQIRYENENAQNDKANCLYYISTIHCLLGNIDLALDNLGYAILMNKALKKNVKNEVEFEILKTEIRFMDIIK